MFQLENSMGIIYLIKSLWRQNLVSVLWTTSLFYVRLAMFVLVATTSRDSKSKNSRRESHCWKDKTFFEKQRERTVWLLLSTDVRWIIQAWPTNQKAQCRTVVLIGGFLMPTKWKSQALIVKYIHFCSWWAEHFTQLKGNSVSFHAALFEFLGTVSFYHLFTQWRHGSIKTTFWVS